MWTICIAALLFGTVALPEPQSAQSLRVILQPDKYIEREYSLDPAAGASYVYLDGEEIRVAVLLFNPRDQAVTVHGVADGVAGVLDLRLVKIEEDRDRPLTARFVPDGAPMFGTVGFPSFGGEWGRSLHLPARTCVRVVVRVIPAMPLSAGVYHVVHAATKGACEPGCSVGANTPRLGFEVRPINEEAERLDWLYRQAMRARDAGDLGRAGELVGRMLEVNPSSSLAYQQMGENAEQAGQWAQAAVAYQRAIEILEAGGDALRVRRSNGQIPPSLVYTKDRLKRVQQRQRDQ